MSRKIAHYLQRLQKIEREVDDTEATITPARATTLYDETEELFEKAETVNDQLVDAATTDEDKDNLYETFDVISDLRSKLKTDLRAYLDTCTKEESRKETPPPSGVKLPKIEPPRFSGDYAAWPSFKDLFEAAVGKNQTISDGQKLQHLKTALSGKPLQLIQEFYVNDANYQGAWELLNKRYDNKWDIASTYAKKFINLKPVTSENADSLCNLIDNAAEYFQILSNLGLSKEDQYDLFKLTTITEKLDSTTLREWIKLLDGRSIPKFDDLQDFLLRYASGLRATKKVGLQNHHLKKTENQPIARAHHGEVSVQCRFCGEFHLHYQCPVFKNQDDVSKRKDMVQRGGLCFNCLNTDHFTRDCKSLPCKKCGMKHHSLLHYDTVKRDGLNRQSQGSSQPRPSQQNRPAGSQHQAPPQVDNNHCEANTHVLLQTAIVSVINKFGQETPCRVFLDNGSQASFITETCAQRLGIKRQRSSMVIGGIGGSASIQAKGKLTISLLSCDKKQKIEAEVQVLPKVTNFLPKVPIDISPLHHFNGIPLADPKYYKPAEVDILLGSDYYEKIVLEAKISGPESTPVARHTLFGWVISGPAPVKTSATIQTCGHVTCDLIQKFWEVEEPPKAKFLTNEEKLCEDHFKKTHTRDSDGRYYVQVPFKPIKSQMGTSRDQAYSDFIKEYEDLGHLRKIPPPVKEVPGETYYFPHHAVINESSTTTKLRVVFDGSAKTSSGLSFNDVVYTGATLQDDLYDHLLRFRTHKIVLKADIAKMFRQFYLQPVDLPMHRIVWRDPATQEISDYELLTVTYGTACAPNLATRCLQQLGQDVEQDFPKASAVLLRDMYVDDLMTGVSTLEEAKHLYHELTGAMSKGKLTLRKWSSNSKEFLKIIPPEDCDTDPSSFDESGLVKALGVQWCPSTDTFTFKYSNILTSGPTTKRQLYSDLAKTYDPLGIISPVILRGKILLQELWKLEIDWDEEIPADLYAKWIAYKEDLIRITEFKFSRHIFAFDYISDPEATFEIHGFGDASEKAYGAVVYIRSILPEQSPVVRLVTSKTRVAPLKQTPLPRLELLAAVLLSELVSYVRDVLQLECPVHLWTDSMITLKWIKASPRRWKTFVANRVALIQSLTSVEAWSHVPGLENPADLASRGCTAEEIISNPMWTQGPAWLSQPGTPTFVSPTTNINPIHLEERTDSTDVHHTEEKSSVLHRFSSLVRMKRVIARILRLKYKATGPLTPEELDRSLFAAIRLTQAEHFGEEMACLLKKQPLPKKSNLKSLYPYVDKPGILRVSGRLTNADLPEEAKHQVILPAKCDLVNLLVRHYHHANLHSGFTLTWATIQQKYWILGGRDVVRNQLRQCVTCKKWKAEEAHQLMGVLPPCRVNPGQPFLHTGIDYAGPFILKNPIGVAPKTYKGYICIFVCMSTKAVHIEVVTSLTTQGFIAAFRRFTSRRGMPSDLYSDNGTNFVGAEKELLKLFEEAVIAEVQGILANEGIKWTFIPPHAPHFGGIWEAAVKSATYHLKRISEETPMTYEDFSTLLCQVESVLNSRPLSPMSPDPADLRPLTPGHFLIGKPLNQVPDRNVLNIKTNRLEHFQRIQQQVQHFWKRWVSEYLNNLQQRNKWWWEQPNLKEGQLVLVKEDNLAPGKWMVGRISAVHPSPSDNLVRRVTIKTASSELERPIVKCIPLLD